MASGPPCTPEAGTWRVGRTLRVGRVSQGAAPVQGRLSSPRASRQLPAPERVGLAAPCVPREKGVWGALTLGLGPSRAASVPQAGLPVVHAQSLVVGTGVDASAGGHSARKALRVRGG